MALNDLETFTMLFNSLKDWVNDSSDTLSWLSEQKPNVRRLAYAVGEAAAKIKKNKATQAEHHQVVPTGFVTAWKRYESQFEVSIAGIVVAEREAGVKSFLVEIEKLAQAKHVSADKFLEDFLQEFRSSRQPGDSFDPIHDDPVELINHIYETYEDVIDNFDEPDYNDKAIGAWVFFEKTLGLDYRAIYDRWKSVPQLMIPNYTLVGGRRSVIDLYNEAARCYVYGNKIAAVAMCRALLEYVLKKHYKIEDCKLGQMITLAERKYSRLKKMNLQEKKNLANEIMHEYERQSEVEDRIVVDFLKTMQSIVQDIPRDA